MRTFAAGLAAAAVLAPALTAAAAPMNVIDEKCRAQVINACIERHRGQFSSSGGGIFGGSVFNEDEARKYCADAGAGKCVITVDIPTTAEVKQIAADANRLQQEQWAAWLRTLEETGVVRPSPAPPPPAPRR